MALHENFTLTPPQPGKMYEFDNITLVELARKFGHKKIAENIERKLITPTGSSPPSERFRLCSNSLRPQVLEPLLPESPERSPRSRGSSPSR